MLGRESLLHEVVHDIDGLPVADVGDGGVHGVILPVGGQQARVRVQVRGQQREEARRLLAEIHDGPRAAEEVHAEQRRRVRAQHVEAQGAA